MHNDAQFQFKTTTDLNYSSANASRCIIMAISHGVSAAVVRWHLFFSFVKIICVSFLCSPLMLQERPDQFFSGLGVLSNAYC